MGRPTSQEAAALKNGSNNPMHMMAQDPSGFMMTQERIVFLSGDVSESSITNVQAQLITLASMAKTPIKLFISTYGGSVDEMFSLYDTIRVLEAPVHTFGLGKIMSAGVLLLSAGVKGSRLIGSHARVMMHALSADSFGTIFQLKNDVNEYSRMQNLIERALMKETKIKLPELRKIMSSGPDFYITPEKAVQLGIVDRVV